jgi:hypothetical protein
MKIQLAPIILFAYNRPLHTRKVLEALQRNELASSSHLVVYVDGPKPNASDEQTERIEAVREIVKKGKWCGSVEYHFSDKNIGCRNSIIQGITEVFSRFESAIILEDDIVTAPSFLTFMNKCLTFYKDYEAVFSISGRTLPEEKFSLPKDYSYDAFVSLRQLNSGWATWKDRWKKIDWDLSFVDELLAQPAMCKAYSRGGDDLIPMLLDQKEGRSDAWDIQFTYNQFRQHAVSIIPKYSYTDNIGGDGSGTHHPKKGDQLHFDLSKAISNPRLPEVIYEDDRIINAFYNVYCAKKRPIWKKIINRISRMLGGKNLFTIKKKIYV